MQYQNEEIEDRISQIMPKFTFLHNTMETPQGDVMMTDEVLEHAIL